MFGQLIAVLQLTGLFAICVMAYLLLLEFLMPSASRLSIAPRHKSSIG